MERVITCIQALLERQEDGKGEELVHSYRKAGPGSRRRLGLLLQV